MRQPSTGSKYEQSVNHTPTNNADLFMQCQKIFSWEGEREGEREGECRCMQKVHVPPQVL